MAKKKNTKGAKVKNNLVAPVVASEEKQILVTYKGNATRSFGGKIFKKGETHPVSANLKNAIDAAMKAIGFSYKTASKSAIKKVEATEGKEIPEIPEVIESTESKEE